MVDIIALPSCPRPADSTMRFISYGTDSSGPLGGEDQRIARLGARFGADYDYAPMKFDDARLFLARLIRAESTLVSLLFPMPGFNGADYGAVEVKGAPTDTTNVGGILDIRGATPGATINEGLFFHVNSGGRRWIHNVAGDVVVAGDGTATLGISPLMRFIPADGDTLDFADVTIEGFVQGNKQEWSIQYLLRYGIKFTIAEDR